MYLFPIGLIPCSCITDQDFAPPPELSPIIQSIKVKAHGEPCHREKASNLYVLDEHLMREEDRSERERNRRDKSFKLDFMLQESQQLAHSMTT